MAWSGQDVWQVDNCTTSALSANDETAIQVTPLRLRMFTIVGGMFTKSTQKSMYLFTIEKVVRRLTRNSAP